MENENKNTESLLDELEQVRELFQKTLDEEREKAERFQCEDVSEEKQETEKGTEKKEKSKHKSKRECECCGELLSDAAFSRHESYCDGCYVKMQKKPLRPWGFIAVLIMIAVFFGSMFTSISSVTDLESSSSTGMEDFFEGYLSYRENELIFCVSFYGSYLSSREGATNVSQTAVRQLIDAYCRMGEYPYAAAVINDYFSSAELKLPWNAKYAQILDKNEIYNETYNAIIGVLQANVTDKGYDYEKIVSGILALKTEENTDAHYIIDIFAFDFGVPLQEDTSVLYRQLVEIDERYPKEYEHLPILCRYAATQGDTELAEDCFERMMKVNRQNMSIYAAYFNCYRYAESPDTAKMLELCNEMATLSAELSAVGYYNYDYLYYLAITYMLTPETGESAFNCMQSLYESINYYADYYEGNTKATDIFNLYALTAAFTGNTQQYEWAKAELEYLGYELSGLVEAYYAGEITLREVIADKGGDIA